MALRIPKNDLTIMDNAVDVHVCNNRASFITYRSEPSSVTETTALGSSSGKGSIHLQLILENGDLGSILTLHEV